VIANVFSLFNFIDCCTNKRSFIIFKLMINCDLSSISHHFKDTVLWSRKPPHPILCPWLRGSLSNFVVKIIPQKAWGNEAPFCENAIILLQLFCHNTLTLQTAYRQTAHYNNSQSLYCNRGLKLELIAVLRRHFVQVKVGSKSGGQINRGSESVPMTLLGTSRLPVFRQK